MAISASHWRKGVRPDDAAARAGLSSVYVRAMYEHFDLEAELDERAGPGGGPGRRSGRGAGADGWAQRRSGRTPVAERVRPAAPPYSPAPPSRPLTGPLDSEGWAKRMAKVDTPTRGGQPRRLSGSNYTRELQILPPRYRLIPQAV